MLSIGEFSQVTRLTVKTIRYYQEIGILQPAKIDSVTGYRYYNQESYRRVEMITGLKELGFSLKEIAPILAECSSDEELITVVRNKLAEVRSQINRLTDLENRLSGFEEENKMKTTQFNDGITECSIQIDHLAAFPLTGSYDTIGKGFQALYKQFGRIIKDKPYAFYYDMEYKENDAKMEAVVALKEEAEAEGFDCRSLPLHKAVKTIHRGEYGRLGETYIRLFEYCREHNYKPLPPIIDHYLKGPGMIFRRNPKNYITECIFLIEDSPGEK